MRRGTTPTIVFHLPFNTSEIRNVEVYFAQDDELIVEKGKDDCTLNGTMLSVTLTQAETLRFSSDDNGKIEMQLRFVFLDGSVEATTIVKEKARKILKNSEIEVTEEEPEPTPEPEPTEPTEGGDTEGGDTDGNN